jgi:hypothetical protein
MLWPLGYVKVPPSAVKLDAGRIRGPFPEPYDEGTQWNNLIRSIKAGVRGVRAGAGRSPVQIIMHIDCGGDWPVTEWWFDHLKAAHVDYDIIGQSFYPRVARHPGAAASEYRGSFASLPQAIHGGRNWLPAIGRRSGDRCQQVQPLARHAGWAAPVHG